MGGLAKYASHFVCGVVMALGLAISGMLEPQKIIGFLDILGKWDPSLMFVMIGALTTHGFFYFFIMRRKKPLLDKRFHLPATMAVDKSLLIGAFVFGAGWGLSGLCPGPSLAALVTLDIYVVLFVSGMVLGMLHRLHVAHGKDLPDK